MRRGVGPAASAARRGEHRRDAGGVVVRAVVDGVAVDRPADAQVIVVGADHHGLFRERRIAAPHQADHVDPQRHHPAERIGSGTAQPEPFALGARAHHEGDALEVGAVARGLETVGSASAPREPRRPAERSRACAVRRPCIESSARTEMMAIGRGRARGVRGRGLVEGGLAPAAGDDQQCLSSRAQRVDLIPGLRPRRSFSPPQRRHRIHRPLRSGDRLRRFDPEMPPEGRLEPLACTPGRRPPGRGGAAGPESRSRARTRSPATGRPGADSGRPAQRHVAADRQVVDQRQRQHARRPDPAPPATRRSRCAQPSAGTGLVRSISSGRMRVLPRRDARAVVPLHRRRIDVERRSPPAASARDPAVIPGVRAQVPHDPRAAGAEETAHQLALRGDRGVGVVVLAGVVRPLGARGLPAESRDRAPEAVHQADRGGLADRPAFAATAARRVGVAARAAAWRCTCIRVPGRSQRPPRQQAGAELERNAVEVGPEQQPAAARPRGS